MVHLFSIIFYVLKYLMCIATVKTYVNCLLIFMHFQNKNMIV